MLPPALQELPVPEGYFVALGDFLFYGNKFFCHFHFRGVMRSHLPDTNWFNLAVKLDVKLNAATRSPRTSSSGELFRRLRRPSILLTYSSP